MRRTTVAVLGVVLVLTAGGLSRASTSPTPGRDPSVAGGAGGRHWLSGSSTPGTGVEPSPPVKMEAGGTPRKPPASAAAMDGSPPVRLSIPRLRVDSDLVALTLLGNGRMEVPDDASTVGWFTGAPTPGSLGPAVLAGHVNWQGRDGAFARLATLVTGDEVRVERLDGSVAVFAVTTSGRFPKDKFPTDAVYGPIDHAGLRLITCGGEFDAATGHYRDNVVVWAVLRL